MTPGPGPQTAAMITAVAMEKLGPNQDGKTKKPEKSAKVPERVTNTEVMRLFDSFVTHAKDLYTKACTPVKLQWKRCVTSTVVVLECLVHVTVL